MSVYVEGLQGKYRWAEGVTSPHRRELDEMTDKDLTYWLNYYDGLQRVINEALEIINAEWFLRHEAPM